MSNAEQCQFKASDGRCCSEPAGDSGLCFWHDAKVDKAGVKLSDALQTFVRSGGVTQGLQLSRADLSGVNLVNAGQQHGFDMSGSDLYRANLTNAHMFNLNLMGGSLMKADLTGANLHCALLEDCNLLGINWHDAKIENICTGDAIWQERQGLIAEAGGDKAMAIDFYQQAEEVYRDLRKASETAGIFELSGFCIQRELTVRRFQKPMFSSRRLVSKLVDLFCGYGEEPHRVVLVSLFIIFSCALIYLFTGLSFSGEIHQLRIDNGWEQNLRYFADCIYYSVVTFTTLGYGDFTPVGLSRLIAAIEAFAGSFTMALFVVVFVKKMTR